MLPLISGRVVLLVLMILSTLSWAIILSKYLKLNALIQADAEFKKRLKESETCLEVYEQALVFPHSPLYHIYRAGAKSSALEMVGDHRPEFLAKTQLVTNNSLNSSQLDTISAAFDQGRAKGLRFLSKGFWSLRVIALMAVALGLVSTVFLMIKSLNEFETGLIRMLVASAVMLVASFSVAFCAEWCGNGLKKRYIKRIEKLNQFHHGMNAVFRSHFLRPEPVTVKPEPVIKLPEMEKQKHRYFSLAQPPSLSSENDQKV